MPGIVFDLAKSARNATERGFSFERAAEFDWSTALVVEDLRREYGERRFQALGRIEGRCYVMVFTPRGGNVHVISLRKAN